MENGKLIQKSGENSQQYQAGTIIVNQGVTEERVRAIFSELIPTSLQAYTSDAYATANQRIERLEDNIWPKLDEVDGLLQAFADPAFQILLRKAQQAAAATEREDDYSLLSELLVCHVEKGSDRKNRTGINQAIEIVDQIDNDALCALTVAHAVTNYVPTSGSCREGLRVLNSLFSRLMYQELPTGMDWLDHLDILGTVRISMLGGMKKFSEYYAKSLNGYVCVGIREFSDDYKKAVEIMKSAQIATNFLVPNECLSGYYRLDIKNEAMIEELFVNIGVSSVPLSDGQKSALKQVWNLYSNDAKLKKEAENNFISLWDAYDALKKLRIWWESIPRSFHLTRVGDILGYTNAKRCCPDIPDMA